MFDNFAGKITKIFDALSGKKFISENDLNATMREMRIALLEADVSLSVAKDFIEKMLENSPEGATALGDHRFDGKLTDLSSAGRTRVIEVRRECLKSLSAIDRAKLMPVNRRGRVRFGAAHAYLDVAVRGQIALDDRLVALRDQRCCVRVQ